MTDNYPKGLGPFTPRTIIAFADQRSKEAARYRDSSKFNSYNRRV